jgi:hypothetical protein
MTQTRIFNSETVLPDEKLTAKACTLLGFDARYARVRDQLRLLLSGDELGAWNRKHYGGKLALVELVAEAVSARDLLRRRRHRQDRHR